MSTWERFEAWLDQDAETPTYVAMVLLVLLAGFIGFLITR